MLPMEDTNYKGTTTAKTLKRARDLRYRSSAKGKYNRMLNEVRRGIRNKRARIERILHEEEVRNRNGTAQNSQGYKDSD